MRSPCARGNAPGHRLCAAGGLRRWRRWIVNPPPPPPVNTTPPTATISAITPAQRVTNQAVIFTGSGNDRWPAAR